MIELLPDSTDSKFKIPDSRYKEQHEKTLVWVIGLRGVGIILACRRPFAGALESLDSPINRIIFW
jgi:hypothetical protein